MKIYILIERHPGENSQIHGCYLSEEEATKFRDDIKHNKYFFIEEHDIIEPDNKEMGLMYLKVRH